MNFFIGIAKFLVAVLVVIILGAIGALLVMFIAKPNFFIAIDVFLFILLLGVIRFLYKKVAKEFRS